MRNLALFTLIGLLMFACESDQPSSETPLAVDFLIPKPNTVEIGSGYFALPSEAQISSGELGEDWQSTLQFWADVFSEESKSTWKVGGQDNAAIVVEKSTALSSPEAYFLEINPQQIRIQASEAAGVYYAFQTLRQLIWANEGHIPVVKISDSPRFAYRGMHLDVGRHFFPVDFIKKYIDLLATYKMNRFHWHLTEDQGWRIEIKQYPKLQEIAAYRKETLIGHYNDQPQTYDGQRYGGFYTQEEVKEVVAYAAKQFVTIIPEIELPGHAQAALAAYPELSCTGGPIEAATKWGVFEEVYCPKENTFTFLENVLTEVMALFPSAYVHIGGDECPKTRWEECTECQALMIKEGLEDEHALQSYFIRRIEKFLNANGRQIIGWDEILEGGLAPNATVMSWRGEEGGIAAAKQGHNVIMTPTTYCYFDYYQSQDPGEPLAIGGFLPLEKVYNYEPIPAELSAEEAKYILGAQGNVWTEYLSTPGAVEYMAYPRAIALAEVVWSAKEDRNFKGFTKRLNPHLRHLKAEGVNTANHLLDVEPEIISGDGEGIKVKLSTPLEGSEIRYTLDGKTPDVNSALYQQPVSVEGTLQLNAQAFDQGKASGRPAKIQFQAHLAAGKKISLEHQPHPKYNAGGIGALINGVNGADERYGDAEWLGFSGKDLIANIDLETSQELESISFRFFNGPGQWIYLPQKVEVSTSEDGTTFNLANSQNINTFNEEKVVNVKVPIKSKGRYLKVHVYNLGRIPEGNVGAGNAPWLFVDEMVVK
ncbi:MAG: beta-N-acetylhexosaminidase [Saprospiraceae bacterium]|nr:MAG: beta-N-acetylhexosaminidase [Saprospiraceae bacterium]